MGRCFCGFQLFLYGFDHHLWLKVLLIWKHLLLMHMGFYGTDYICADASATCCLLRSLLRLCYRPPRVLHRRRDRHRMLGVELRRVLREAEKIILDFLASLLRWLWLHTLLIHDPKLEVLLQFII